MTKKKFFCVATTKFPEKGYLITYFNDANTRYTMKMTLVSSTGLKFFKKIKNF